MGWESELRDVVGLVDITERKYALGTWLRRWVQQMGVSLSIDPSAKALMSGEELKRYMGHQRDVMADKLGRVMLLEEGLAKWSTIEDDQPETVVGMDGRPGYDRRIHQTSRVAMLRSQPRIEETQSEKEAQRLGHEPAGTQL